MESERLALGGRYLRCHSAPSRALIFSLQWKRLRALQHYPFLNVIIAMRRAGQPLQPVPAYLLLCGKLKANVPRYSHSQCPRLASCSCESLRRSFQHKRLVVKETRQLENWCDSEGSIGMLEEHLFFMLGYFKDPSTHGEVQTFFHSLWVKEHFQSWASRN